MSTIARLVVEDPAEAWDAVQRLRQRFLPTVWEGSPATSESWRRGVNAVMHILKRLEGVVNSEVMCPGHGPGHWARDYINAIRLLAHHSMWVGRTEVEIVSGFVAAVLHDVGNAVVERYRDANTPVRHAEVGALLLQEIFRSDPCGLTDAEQVGVLWGVAAHTHFLKPQEVNWTVMNTTITVTPYEDSHNGRPLYGVVFPRMVDRNDCSGAHGFPWRHLLTTIQEHYDFSGDDWSVVRFVPHLEPRVRPFSERDGGQRMLEHMEMFALSQTSSSPYGRHDYGRMLTIRDPARRTLRNFIDVVENDGHGSGIESSWPEFKEFLGVIEPSQVGKDAAATLIKMMQDKLARDVQGAWLRGVHFGIQSYIGWQADVHADLSAVNAQMELPIIGEITSLLKFRPEEV